MRRAQPSQQGAVLRAPLRRGTFAKARDGGARQHLHPCRAHARDGNLQVRTVDLNPRARAESCQLPELRIIPQTDETHRQGEKTNPQWGRPLVGTCKIPGTEPLDWRWLQTKSRGNVFGGAARQYNICDVQN